MKIMIQKPLPHQAQRESSASRCLETLHKFFCLVQLDSTFHVSLQIDLLAFRMMPAKTLHLEASYNIVLIRPAPSVTHSLVNNANT